MIFIDTNHGVVSGSPDNWYEFTMAVACSKLSKGDLTKKSDLSSNNFRRTKTLNSSQRRKSFRSTKCVGTKNAKGNPTIRHPSHTSGGIHVCAAVSYIP